jgi:Domain of unknown function (DUF4177)
VHEYKVLTERDKRFSGGFDADVLTDTLNAFAAEGWRLAESFVAANLMKSPKANVVLILERNRSELSETAA